MGYVTALGNKLGELGQAGGPVADALAASPDWAAWQQRVLAPRNETENVYRWGVGPYFGGSTYAWLGMA